VARAKGRPRKKVDGCHWAKWVHDPGPRGRACGRGKGAAHGFGPRWPGYASGLTTGSRTGLTVFRRGPVIEDGRRRGARHSCRKHALRVGQRSTARCFVGFSRESRRGLHRIAEQAVAGAEDGNFRERADPVHDNVGRRVTKSWQSIRRPHWSFRPQKRTEPFTSPAPFEQWRFERPDELALSSHRPGATRAGRPSGRRHDVSRSSPQGSVPLRHQVEGVDRLRAGETWDFWITSGSPLCQPVEATAPTAGRPGAAFREHTPVPCQRCVDVNEPAE